MTKKLFKENKNLVDCKKCYKLHENNPSKTPCRMPKRCPYGIKGDIL
jgi:hypothetical protein